MNCPLQHHQIVSVEEALNDEILIRYTFELDESFEERPNNLEKMPFVGFPEFASASFEHVWFEHEHCGGMWLGSGNIQYK